MEHYDWNEGWLFAPTFDPALVRPECPELSLTPVRLPHTVKPLPYNYCNENDYQRLCGYRREFFAPKEWLGRTVLLTFGAVAHDATVFCNGRRGCNRTERKYFQWCANSRKSGDLAICSTDNRNHNDIHDNDHHTIHNHFDNDHHSTSIQTGGCGWKWDD